MDLIYYKNSLGTNLKIELSENSIWCDTATKGITNMPSYEIFTSPDYRKTEGIVYNSKPLFYNGKLIDNFYLKFKDGKVVDYDAEVGYETLKGIIESDSNSCYLGECAIVENDSPISKLNLNSPIFRKKLFNVLSLKQIITAVIDEKSLTKQSNIIDCGQTTLQCCLVEFK